MATETLRQQIEMQSARIGRLAVAQEVVATRIARLVEQRSARRVAPDPVEAFDHKVQALCGTDALPYDQAYLRIKREQPAVYLTYATRTGIGGLSRRAPRRA